MLGIVEEEQKVHWIDPRKGDFDLWMRSNLGEGVESE